MTLIIIIYVYLLNKKWTINCEGAIYQNLKIKRKIIWGDVKQNKAFYMRVKFYNFNDDIIFKLPYPADLNKKNIFINEIEKISSMKIEL